MSYSPSTLQNGPARLTAAVAAVCPVSGLCIGVYGDPASVLCVYDAAATAPQRAAALALIAGFDWTDAATDAYLAAREPKKQALVAAATQAVADIDGYLAIASPTNPQVVAAVRRLAQIVRALIVRAVEV